MITKEININDIAKKLGVSKSTVSKALNDRPDVGEKTKMRVRELVEKLNYAPNHFAQALNFRKSKLIGIIMHDDIDEGFSAQLVRNISVELQKHGYAFVFASSQRSGIREREIIAEHMSRFIDASILIPCAHPDVKAINDMIGQGYKLVVVDNCVDGIKGPFIGTDFTMGSYLATKHLIDVGHRTIGYIGGPQWAASTSELEEGYRKAHHEAGLKVNEKLTVACEYDEIEAEEKFIKLKKENPMMTAVHCSQSAMAVGTLAGTVKLGLNVPGDISVISSGSTELVSSINPKVEEIGRTVIKVLLAYMGGKDFPVKSLIAPELALRNSVKCIKG